jgi:hypothetical protein
MKFSDTTNKEAGIIQGIERTTGLGYGKISGDSDNLAYFTMLVNHYVNMVGQWIRHASGEMPYDDYNHGNLPVEEYSFTDDQPDYGLDTDIARINKVRIRDASTEEYSEIDYMSQADIPEDWFNQTKGTPLKYYFPTPYTIMFDPPPDTTKYDKYELTYNRDMHLFLVGDTIAVPGFNVTFHPILIYGPSRDWAMINNKDGNKNAVIALCNQMLGDNHYQPSGLYKMLLQHYSKFNANYVPAIKRASPSGGSWK